MPRKIKNQFTLDCLLFLALKNIEFSRYIIRYLGINKKKTYLYLLQNGESGLVRVYSRICDSVLGSLELAITGKNFFQWPNDRIPISAHILPSGF